MPAPTAEEFKAWRDSPVSQWVFGAIEISIDEQRREWERRSWANGECDPTALVELRARADGMRALIDSNYMGLCETHGHDPVTE